MLSDDQIQAALTRVGPGLEKYQWIQSQVHRCDVTRDATFQRRFNGFYRIRRGEGWRSTFYALMERSKRNGATFEGVLRELHSELGRVEASFASKLVATLDPDQPVIDRFVLENFGLELPKTYASKRLQKTVDVHATLVYRYGELLASPTGKQVVARFDERYPDADISNLKKVDLVLWQNRE